MKKKYKIGTKLLILNASDQGYDYMIDGDILTVADNQGHNNTYKFEEATDDPGWSPSFIENLTKFQPLNNWKCRYEGK